MKIALSLLTTTFLTIASTKAALIISQYIETDSGITPKGIELWNTGPTIDLSINNLEVSKSLNGGVPAVDFSLNTGIIAAGEVIVIGTSDIGNYMDTIFGDGSSGSSTVQYFEEGFTFNGDDALVIKLGVATQDVFGTPGSDPGSAWSGNGVETQNSNIQLINNTFTTGDTDGWSDPSARFSTVSTTPSGAGGLAGFGVAPAVPEPAAALLGAFGLLSLLRRRR